MGKPMWGNLAAPHDNPPPSSKRIIQPLTPTATLDENTLPTDARCTTVPPISASANETTPLSASARPSPMHIPGPQDKFPSPSPTMSNAWNISSMLFPKLGAQNQQAISTPPLTTSSHSKYSKSHNAKNSTLRQQRPPLSQPATFHAPLSRLNPSWLPWIMAQLMHDPQIAGHSELNEELRGLLKEFKHWNPSAKVFKELRYNLEPLKSKL